MAIQKQQWPTNANYETHPKLLELHLLQKAVNTKHTLDKRRQQRTRPIKKCIEQARITPIA